MSEDSPCEWEKQNHQWDQQSRFKAENFPQVSLKNWKLFERHFSRAMRDENYWGDVVFMFIVKFNDLVGFARVPFN
jgi:hypothetical protein